MEHPGEYSTVLGQILSELKSKHQSVSHPELCGWLCSRFDLVHLAKLRSVLFHSASQDPSFPATLFRDRMRCSSVDPHSKKLQVAADVVSMFNLIHSRSPAKERLPMSRAPLIKNHSVGSTDYHPPHPPHPPHPLHGSAHKHKQGAESGLHHFIPASDPNFLLRVSKDLKCRAASLDKLHPLPLYGPGPLGPSCEMQSTYFPMDVDSEASTELESLSQPQLGPQEPRAARSCVHKRNVFKEDFHNMSAFSPKVHRQASDCAEGIHQRELHRPAVFFNHSFELPCTNPYMDPGFNSPLDERHRAKHESLDDLQASTYFGPSTVSESVSSRRFPDREPPHKGNSKAGRPTRPVKSFSLNTDYVPAPSTKPMATKRPLRNMAAINGEREPSKTESPAFNKKVSDFKGQEVSPLSNGPDCVERKGDSPWFEGRTASRGFQRPDVASNVGTQTEKGSEPKRLRSFSRTDSEMISDDISDIFRFLDDMSVCDSLNMIQSSCYNSTGSLSQLTLRSDSSPERSTVRLAKSRLDSLFHSLDNSDDELKSNVHRLVQRIGEIEKKLESLSGVRTEITQLLSKLNQLDHKVHKPHSTDETDPSPAPSDSHPSSQTYQSHTMGRTNVLSTGHTNGHSVGQSTGLSRTHTGGHTNSNPSGHISGHSNGHTTGGPSDGHTQNGHTLGHSTVHFTGHTSGLSNIQSGGHTSGHTTSGHATSGHASDHSGGHASGHSGGHASGHSGGHASGHSGGHASDHSGGHASGHSGGHASGHSGGHASGHSGGHASGHSSAHASGHSGAHASGHSSAHASGHSSAHASGHSGGHASGHSSAHASGHSSAHASGHSSAHASGHSSAHASGHSGGHASGHSSAHASGHSGGHVTGHAGGHAGGHSNGHSSKQHKRGHSHTLADWSSSQVTWSSPGESMGVKALKNSLMRRSSRSLNQEPAPDWSTTVYCTERPRTHREQEHPYEVSRIRPGPVDFPPPPFTPSRQKHLQSGPVYTDLSPAVKSSPVYSELRLDSTRLHPGWGSAEGYSRHPEQRPKQLKALDAQGGAALDPAHLEYWLEDVYSPGFDSLLRRKQADLRRARLCKLGALITAATCTLLLVIVVPICTMRT